MYTSKYATSLHHNNKPAKLPAISLETSTPVVELMRSGGLSPTSIYPEITNTRTSRPDYCNASPACVKPIGRKPTGGEMQRERGQGGGMIVSETRPGRPSMRPDNMDIRVVQSEVINDPGENQVKPIMSDICCRQLLVRLL